MSRPLPTLAAACLALLAAGCAQTGGQGGERYSPVVMRTGSNIPVGRERDQQPREKTLAEEAMMEELRKLRTPTATSGN